ncbi:hypothetical protein BLA29_001997, partial [Euroglyphus maynei]
SSSSLSSNKLNPQQRRKKKLKYPPSSDHHGNEQEQNFIPLNDLSPKTLRKNPPVTENSATASVTIAAEWQENSNNSHLFNDTKIEEGINPLDDNIRDVVSISMDNLNVQNRAITNDNRSSTSTSSSSSSSIQRQQNRTSETFDV